MKLKQSVLYRLRELKNSIIAFYLVIIAIIVLLSVLKSIDTVNVTSFGDVEIGSMILLFILGLCSFKATFYMFVQNGVSRKTMFYSYLISAIIASGIMALIDSVCFTLLEIGGYFSPTFEQIYPGFYDDVIVPKIVIAFLWALSAYITVSVIGYLITVLYYRMNKTLKLIVSISTPCLVFIILPTVDVYYGGKIMSAVRKCLQFLLGTGEYKNPFSSIITCSCLSVILAIFSYGLVKRVAIKRN